MPFKIENPGDYDAWEIAPSTRINTSIWTRANPVDVTLATAGTAEDLIAISDEKPTINMATNPSFETADPPTGYTLVGSTLARSATVARSGTYSMSIVPNNVAAGEGGYWTTTDLAQGNVDRNQQIVMVASVYLQDNAASGSTARVVIADSSGVTLANGTTVTLSAAWQRSSAFYPLSAAAASYRIYIVTALQHGTTFYTDDLQVELLNQSTPTAYCDGATGLYNEWRTTAHASISRRKRGLVAIRGYTLHCTRDIWIAEGRTAHATDGGSRYVRAGTDFWEDWPLDVQDNISILNVQTGEQPRVYGVVRGVHQMKHQ
ncbi:MAG: hypothetical protein ABIH92_03315 [Nanoarchaeota archaeon]